MKHKVKMIHIKLCFVCKKETLINIYLSQRTYTFVKKNLCMHCIIFFVLVVTPSKPVTSLTFYTVYKYMMIVLMDRNKMYFCIPKLIVSI